MNKLSITCLYSYIFKCWNHKRFSRKRHHIYKTVFHILSNQDWLNLCWKTWNDLRSDLNFKFRSLLLALKYSDKLLYTSKPNYTCHANYSQFLTKTKLIIPPKSYLALNRNNHQYIEQPCLKITYNCNQEEMRPKESQDPYQGPTIWVPTFTEMSNFLINQLNDQYTYWF